MSEKQLSSIDGEAIMGEYATQSDLFKQADLASGDNALQSYLDNLGVDLDGLYDFCYAYTEEFTKSVGERERAVPAMMRAFTLGVVLGRKHAP